MPRAKCLMEAGCGEHRPTESGDIVITDIAELQAVLDHTLASASPFTRGLFVKAPSAASVVALINDAHELTVATTSPSGVPHAALVVAGCVDGQIVFTVSPGSVLERNLNSAPRVAITCSSRPAGLMGQGAAVLIGRYRDLPEMHDHFRGRLDGYDGLLASSVTSAGGSTRPHRRPTRQVSG